MVRSHIQTTMIVTLLNLQSLMEKTLITGRVATKPPFLIESFFLAYDENLWDMVVDGYTHPVNSNGNKLDRRKMSEN